MMESYNSGTGLIGGDGWWTSAVALSTIMTYQQTTGDTSYGYAIAGAFNANKGSGTWARYEPAGRPGVVDMPTISELTGPVSLAAWRSRAWRRARMVGV